MRQKNSGFTIIELLIVISVLSVLMAMIFPVLSASKENAQSLKCASNLKQIVLAWLCFADQNEGYACQAYSLPNSVDNSWVSKLQPYLRSKSDLVCPTYKQMFSNEPNNKKIMSDSPLGYAYNTTFIGGGEAESYTRGKLESCKATAIQMPSRTAVFSDAIWWGKKTNHPREKNCFHGYLYLRSPEEQALHTSKQRGPSLYRLGTAHFRHQHRANVAFADGHVQSVPNMQQHQITKDVAALPHQYAKYDISE